MRQINAPIKHNANIKKRLQGLFLSFSEDDHPTLELLLEDVAVKRLKPGQEIYRIGSICDSFLLLLTGTVRVQLSSPRGRQITLRRLGPGDHCSLTTSCLLGRSVYPADAISESHGEAVAISRETFHRAFEQSPGFRRFVLEGYAFSHANLIARIEQLAFVPIDTRLSNALLDFHEKGEDRVTHQELAVELGTAREVVSRRLKQFESEGWVRLARGRITVSDRNSLRQLGNPCYLD
ncbi:MAG: cyclic nucleotide-binding domain-containing protein [Gammaproteobacteria bacterium]|jgi:CRP/FNR family transcriptional regulator|nr:cyclic nucleotide-binding domain-containing protein [Gammaproteobacteria bacterium]